MIKHLILNNLVLVDSCEIHFGPAFNAVTGETGAGKTALIEAIGLCLGERADTTLIRKGCDKASVELAFDIEQWPHIKQELDDAGLFNEADEYLVIRREISKEGKNRAFINCRMAPLPLLQKIGRELIDRIGQHAHHSLRTNEAQTKLIDLFASLESDLKIFQTAHAKEKDLQKKLAELQHLSLHREREEATSRFQLEEIETAHLKKGEEETTFEKYQRLAHAQEFSEKIDMMTQGLSDSSSAILPQVARFIKTCESLQTYDPTFGEIGSLFNEAKVSLDEALRTLQSRSQNQDSDSNALQFLENRLSTIARLKRKYGQTFEEIDTFHQKIKTELAHLENLSETLKAAEETLENAKTDTTKIAHTLTKKRKEAATQFQKILTAHLQELNMSGAKMTIEITPQPRTSNGDDLTEFWLKANTGEPLSLVKESASGGELSRLLFAIKIALAEKNNTPSLIFDEIDANVGGTTATIIGEKLKSLGACRQVICITHFPQVASKADAHFAVQKIEAEGRTLTEIKLLSKLEREQELLRMVGGNWPTCVREAQVQR